MEADAEIREGRLNRHGLREEMQGQRKSGTGQNISRTHRDELLGSVSLLGLLVREALSGRRADALGLNNAGRALEQGVSFIENETGDDVRCKGREIVADLETAVARGMEEGQLHPPEGDEGVHFPNDVGRDRAQILGRHGRSEPSSMRLPGCV